MRQVQQITDDPNQTQTIILDDGTQLSLTMYYSSTQQGWFFTNITYGEFVLNSIRITIYPNLLHQWKNVLPFGLGVYPTTTTREPTLQTDFASGLFQMFILDADEVDSFTQFLSLGEF